MLAHLASVPDVAFYSLQIGAGAAQAAADAALELIDLTPRLQDFSDTAALVHNLDLVITIDTSVAHLAGAMGVPVWVMLNATPDWRYHLGRSDNPWYPSMRLYRQAREGEWAQVAEKVTQDLRDLAAA
jgi:ADP-heptose:LPS heptosyltransferase